MYDMLWPPSASSRSWGPLNLSVAGQTAQTQRIVHHVELIWLSYHVFYYIVIHDIRL